MSSVTYANMHNGTASFEAHPHGNHSSRGPSPAPPYLPSDNVDPFHDTRILASDRPDGARHPGPPGTGISAPTRLPFFEAALARSRQPDLREEPASYLQPLPAYLPAHDPNHPDLSVGFTQFNTVRYAFDRGRGISRSPSPEPEDHTYYGGQDVEKALLVAGDIHEGPDDHDITWHKEKFPSSLMVGDEGDLSLPPFRGQNFVSEATRPSIHIREPTDQTLPPSTSVQDSINPSTTQHFGPAPSGRVGRRTHNAAGHRRIKQNATLDENGFFAVDMPIPTRLAQFLPFKGVEEQKSTR